MLREDWYKNCVVDIGRISCIKSNSAKFTVRVIVGHLRLGDMLSKRGVEDICISVNRIRIFDFSAEHKKNMSKDRLKKLNILVAEYGDSPVLDVTGDVQKFKEMDRAIVISNKFPRVGYVRKSPDEQFPHNEPYYEYELNYQ